MGKSKISPTLRARIYARDGHACLRCKRGEPEVRLEIDHIVPRSRGGHNKEGNLQTLCEACNKLKLDHLPGDSAEAIVLKWAEEVFGPIACNEKLRPRHSRRLIRRLAIVHDFTALLDAAHTDD